MAPKKAAAKAVAKKSAKEEKMTKKRTKKDKNAPKRGKSAYICYVTEARKVLIAKEPSLAKDVAKVGSILGAQWKKLTEAQKVPYNRMAAEDKKRYEAEKAAYQKKQH